MSREPRPRASFPQDSTFQAPEAPIIPSVECGVPSNPPQHRYEMRRPPISPHLEPSLRRTPVKRARTLSLGELSRHSQPDPRAPTDSQRPSRISPEAIIERPMVTAPPIEGNSDYRAKPFHFELYFDLEVIKSFGIHLDCSRGTISSTL